MQNYITMLIHQHKTETIINYWTVLATVCKISMQNSDRITCYLSSHFLLSVNLKLTLTLTHNQSINHYLYSTQGQKIKENNKTNTKMQTTTKWKKM